MTGTLGSVSLTSPASFAAAALKWIEEAKVQAPEYERAYFDAPGVSGQGVKWHGFRERRILVTAWYTAASEAALQAAIKTDFDALAAATFTATLAGVEYPCCQLEPESAAESPRKVATAVYAARVTFVIIQTRLSASG
jgi:hypothetical protein